MWGCNNQLNQAWRAVDVGDGYYKLETMYDVAARTNLALTVNVVGNRMEVQPYAGLETQKFRFYLPQVWKEDHVSFTASEWVKNQFNKCPTPYWNEIDDRDAHYQDLDVNDGVNQSAILARSDDNGDVGIWAWYGKTLTGPRSGGIRFSCVADAPPEVE